MTGGTEVVTLRGHRLKKLEGVIEESMEVIKQTDEIQLTRLKELEETYRRGLEGALEASRALREIHETELWRVIGYSTFEAYCKHEHGIAKRTAYQQIEAAEVWDAVRRGAPNSPPIPSERVARELAPVFRARGDEGVAEAWGEVVADLPAGTTATGPRVHAVLVAKGHRPKPGKASATSGSGRLNTRILIQKFGEKLTVAENRLNWFLTEDIANRRSIGEDTRKLAGEYADRLNAMSKRLREFAEGE